MAVTNMRFFIFGPANLTRRKRGVMTVEKLLQQQQCAQNTLPVLDRDLNDYLSAYRTHK
jgi:hypothetical protein